MTVCVLCLPTSWIFDKFKTRNSALRNFKMHFGGQTRGSWDTYVTDVTDVILRPPPLRARYTLLYRQDNAFKHSLAVRITAT